MPKRRHVLVSLIAVAATIGLIESASAGLRMKRIKFRVRVVSKAPKKVLENVGAVLKTGVSNVGQTSEIAIRDLAQETGRTVENVGAVTTTLYHFAENQADSFQEGIKDAAQRLKEGKALDAMWHFAMLPTAATMENATKAAVENKWVYIGMAVSAGAFGGPGGSAAFAAAMTYQQTGDPSLAIRTGIEVGVKSYLVAQATSASTELLKELELADRAAVAAGAANAVKASTMASAIATLPQAVQTALVSAVTQALLSAADGKSLNDILQQAVASAVTSGLATSVQVGQSYLLDLKYGPELASVASLVNCAQQLKNGGIASCPGFKNYLKDAGDRYLMERAGELKFVKDFESHASSGWAFLKTNQSAIEATLADAKRKEHEIANQLNLLQVAKTDFAPGARKLQEFDLNNGAELTIEAIEF